MAFSRVEHRERIRSRQREIVLRVTLIFVSLVLLVASIVLLISTTKPQETAADAPEVQVIVRYATEEEQEEQEEHDQETLLALARTVWGEARGCSETEQAAVVWCVLNRSDSPDFPDNPLEVVQQPNQFSGYSQENPVLQEHLALVEDVMDRWQLEKTAVGDVGRVLPKEYIYFAGDGLHNHFRRSYKGGDTWDWSLDSPYEGGEP